jgi:predicted transcriptional regulator YheO
MDFDAQHFTLIIVALITGLISPLALQILQFFLKKKQEKKKHTLAQNDAIKTDELITTKLRFLMDKYKSDRVWLAEFHNGGKTYSGKSFQRFSTTYEVVNQGIAAEAVNTQNIPTSIFSLFFKKLMEYGYYYTNDVKQTNDPMSYAMQNFWENRGVSSFICISIKDIAGNFVGFLCMEGVINDMVLIEEEIQKLIITASNLAGYLEV